MAKRKRRGFIVFYLENALSMYRVFRTLTQMNAWIAQFCVEREDEDRIMAILEGTLHNCLFEEGK